MNERLLKRWGSKYIFWVLAITRLLGLGGGALAIYYVYLTLEFSSQVLFHWIAMGTTVVIFALTLQVFQGLWETKALRHTLWLLARDQPAPAELAAKAGYQAVTFPIR
ncbi:MAG: hypothetical protein JSV03_00020, partial [Planctomycetota bacterium]